MKKIAAILALVFAFATLGLLAPSAATAAPASVSSVAVPQWHSGPCLGFCTDVDNMYWSLNTSGYLGICDLCGTGSNYNKLLGAGQNTLLNWGEYDVDGYYIGTGACAKEFWTDEYNSVHEISPRIGPVKVTIGGAGDAERPGGAKKVQVYVYPAQAGGVGCYY